MDWSCRPGPANLRKGLNKNLKTASGPPGLGCILTYGSPWQSLMGGSPPKGGVHTPAPVPGGCAPRARRSAFLGLSFRVRETGMLAVL